MTINLTRQTVVLGTSQGEVPQNGLPAQYISLVSTSAHYSNVTGNQLGTSDAAISTGPAIFTVNNSPLQITANFKSIVTINWELWCASSLAILYIGKNGNALVNSIQTSPRNFQANDLVRLTTTIVVVAGDYLTFNINTGAPRSDTTQINLNIVAQQIS